MTSTTWRSFSAEASFTPGFSTSGSHFYSASLSSSPSLQLFCFHILFSLPLAYVSLPFPSTANLSVLNFSADTGILPSYFLFKEVGGMSTGGTQLPPVVCVYAWCALYLYVLSTLELVNFRALRVHVRVIQRVARWVAVGRRRRVLWRVSV